MHLGHWPAIFSFECQANTGFMTFVRMFLHLLFSGMDFQNWYNSSNIWCSYLVNLSRDFFFWGFKIMSTISLAIQEYSNLSGFFITIMLDVGNFIKRKHVLGSQLCRCQVQELTWYWTCQQKIKIVQRITQLETGVCVYVRMCVPVCVCGGVLLPPVSHQDSITGSLSQ